MAAACAATPIEWVSRQEDVVSLLQRGPRECFVSVDAAHSAAALAQEVSVSSKPGTEYID